MAPFAAASTSAACPLSPAFPTPPLTPPAAASGMAAPDPDAACPVCLTAAPGGVLDPCGHALCPCCAAALPAPRCPLCRADAAHVRTRGGARLSVPAMLRARRARAERVRAHVPVHVIAGPAGVDKGALAAALTALHPLDEANAAGIVRDALAGSEACSPEESSVLDELPGGVPNAPNIFVGGVGVFVRVVRLASYARTETLREIAELKPDFLMMVCSTQSFSSFQEMLVWDERLRAAAASGELLAGERDGAEAGEGGSNLRRRLPTRVWVFTVPRRTDWNDAGLHVVDMRQDLGNAMELVPLWQRPATTLTLRVDELLRVPRNVQQLARRALFYSIAHRPVAQVPHPSVFAPAKRARPWRSATIQKPGEGARTTKAFPKEGRSRREGLSTRVSSVLLRIRRSPDWGSRPVGPSSNSVHR